MKKFLLWMVGVGATVSAALSATPAAAQCYQNGIACGSTTATATSGQPVPNSGTLILGTDTTNALPILTDSNGRPIININSLPSLPTGANTIGSIGNTGFNITGTLPAFAATPTFNIGSLNGAATEATLALIRTALGSPLQAGGSIGNTSFGATQSGTWNVGLSTGSNVIGSIANTSFNFSGAVTTAAPTYTTGTSQAISLTTAGAVRVDGSATTQPVSGSVSLATGSNVVGSISNTGFNITGTLPAFAATPTVNLGTISGAATDTNLTSVRTALGSPFQAGGSIGNTSFGATTADGGDVTFGAKADPKCTTTDTTACSAIGLLKGGNANTSAALTSLSQLHTDMVAATPAGTNVIGKVGIDQTTPGTTNGVVINSGSVGLNAGTSTIGNIIRAVPYNESVTPLGVSATFTGPARDSGTVGAGVTWATFACFVVTDKAGTLNLQGSNDNSTWYTELTQAIAVNVPVSLTGRIFTQYHRCVVVNSTTAQTTLKVNSQLGQ